MSYQPAPPANLNQTHLSQIHPDPSNPASSSVHAPTPSFASGPGDLKPSAQKTASSAPGAPPTSWESAYRSFTPPFPPTTPFPRHSIVIEFCDRCRWVHRATWTQTELLATFGERKEEDQAVLQADQGNGKIKSVTLMPLTSEETGGRFRVWVYSGQGEARCVYDRKVRGGFPELKELKQLIRDVISPNQSLGHSDHSSKKHATHSTADDPSTDGAGAGSSAPADAANPNDNGKPGPAPVTNAQGNPPPVSGTGNDLNTGTATTD